MKDTRLVLDAVRAKIPGDAKLLVVYIGNNGHLICSQANMSQRDISLVADSLHANLLAEKLGRK